MQIEISLTEDEAGALRRFGHEMGAELPDAAKTALRDWLLKRGYLERALAPQDMFGNSAAI